MTQFPNTVPTLPVDVAADINIVDSDNRSIVQINNVAGGWQDIAPLNLHEELSPKNISQFNHWFSSVPTTATTVAGHSKQLMTCSFEFSQLVKAKDGSGSLGAVYKPGTKQFGAQARFQDAENLKSLVNTAMVFNIASQLVAQKHLADINERLQAIDEKLNTIREFLEDSRFAKVQAFREHLQIVVNLISSGDSITDDTLQILAISAQEVRAKVIHIKKNIADAHEKIWNFEPHSWFGSDDVRDQLKKDVDSVHRLQSEYLIGMQCLMLANLILFIKHGGKKEFALAGESYLNELNGANGISSKWDTTKRAISLHLSKMKPLFERPLSSQANALQVERKVKQVDGWLRIDTDEISNLNARIQAAQSPKVLLEMVNGRVERGAYLS